MVFTSFFDISVQVVCILLCAFLVFILGYTDIAFKLRSLYLLLTYSLIVTILLAILLRLAPIQEYAHVYWISQTFSYLLEVAVCIQLTKMVLVNNWYVTSIFAPLISVIAAANTIMYGIPNNIGDIIHQSYIASILCMFTLVIVWSFQGRLEGKLKKPYSGITAVFSAYIVARFCINYIHSYYGNSHWWLLGRLQPLNELIFLIGLTVSILSVTSTKPCSNAISHSI